MVQHLLRRAVLHQHAALQDGYAVGDLGHHAEVVGHEQQRHAPAALQVPHQRQDLGLGGDVQRRRRLVGDQHVRLQRQGGGDGDALPLPAGELVRVGGGGAGRVGQADLGQQVEHAGLDGGAGQVRVGAERLGYLVADAVQRVERGGGVLEHHRDAGASDAAHVAFRQRQKVRASQGDAPARHGDARRQQAQHGGGQQGLAGAAFADEAQDLAGVHMQGDAVQRQRPVGAGRQAKD